MVDNSDKAQTTTSTFGRLPANAKSMRYSAAGERLSARAYLDVAYAPVYLPLLIAGAAFAAWCGISRKAVEYNHSAADSVYAIIIDVGYVGIAAARVGGW